MNHDDEDCSKMIWSVFITSVVLLSALAASLAMLLIWIATISAPLSEGQDLELTAMHENEAESICSSVSHVLLGQSRKGGSDRLVPVVPPRI